MVHLGGLSGVSHGALTGEHLVDTLGGDRGTGHHDEHHADEQEAHNHLHGVLDEGHHIAHLQIAGGDLLAAEPDDQQRQTVHHQHHEGHHGSHGPVHKQSIAGQVLVGLFKPVLHKGLVGEGAHHHQAAQLLPAHQVQPVDQGLHLLETGHGHREQGEDQAQHHDQSQGQHPGQIQALGQTHDQTADAHDGSKAHHPQANAQKVLHLGDIVGGPGDQAGAGELVHLVVVEVAYLAEYIPPQIAAHARAQARHAEACRDGAHSEQDGKARHAQAHLQNVRGLDGIGVRAQLGVKALGQHHAGLLQHAFRSHCRGGDGFIQLLIQRAALQHGGELGHSAGIQRTAGLLLGFGGGIGRGQLLHHVHQGIGCPVEGIVCTILRVGGQRQILIPCIGVGLFQLVCVLPFAQRLVGRIHQSLILLGHEHLHHSHGITVNDLRRRLGDAALLQAHVHDVAHVVGQRQLQHCLAEQQRHAHKQQAQIGL